jgi:hypothetical protein
MTTKTRLLPMARPNPLCGVVLGRFHVLRRNELPEHAVVNFSKMYSLEKKLPRRVSGKGWRPGKTRSWQLRSA